MSEELDSNPATMFWVIGAAALVWNSIGMMFYYVQVTMTTDVVTTFPENQQAFFNNMPAWATSAHGLAVTAGVLGSAALLLRSAWAVPLFVASLIGILVQNIHAFLLADGLEVFGVAGAALPVIVIVIAIALVMYSRSAKSKGLIA